MCLQVACSSRIDLDRLCTRRFNPLSIVAGFDISLDHADFKLPAPMYICDTIRVSRNPMIIPMVPPMMPMYMACCKKILVTDLPEKPKPNKKGGGKPKIDPADWWKRGEAPPF